MIRPTSRVQFLVGVIAGAALSLSAAPARGEPKDAAAQELAKKAIYSDYLATKFEDAEKKLKQAIALCGETACSDKVKAQLHRDLGVVYVGGMNRVEEGKMQFVIAMKGDPTIALEPDLASPEIEAAFAESKKTAGGASPAIGPSATPASPPAPGPSPAAPPPAQGDMVHTPPTEQAILTAVPLYAELPKGTAAAKVQISYKPFGASEWKTIAMMPVSEGYGFEVPCLEIGSATGPLKYYIQAFDVENNLVSWSGTRAAPNSVPIVRERQGDPAHLPGRPAPTSCTDTGYCPPGFPGCPSHSRDGDTNPCEGDDCPGAAPKPESGARKNWVSLAVQQDFLFLSSATQTCSGGTDYDCFNADAYYAGVAYDKSGGELSGGLGLGTTRILAGYDRSLYNFTLGVRVGFAFGGGPQAPGGRAFFPVHAEGRMAYWFGADPFGRAGLRGYVTLAGGLAQVDSNVAVTVYETEGDFVADKRLALDAWRKAGTGFVALGGGALYAITPRMGPFGEIRVIQLLGASNTGMGLQVGYSFGF